MITKITEPTFKTSDDKRFDNLALAQEHELELLIEEVLAGHPVPEVLREQVCKKLVAESDRVIDILSTRANSRPKARAVNGATRKKRTKATAETSGNIGERPIASK